MTAVSVCLFVCPRAYLCNYKSDLYQIFNACYLWPWLGPPLAALCISGFTDNGMFAHKPGLLDVAAQLKHSYPTHSLGLGYERCSVIPVAGQ